MEVVDARVFWAMALIGLYLAVTLLNWLLAFVFGIIF